MHVLQIIILRRNKFVYFRFRKVQFYGGNSTGPEGVIWHVADQENNGVFACLVEDFVSQIQD